MQKNHNRVNNNDICTAIIKDGKRIRILYEREKISDFEKIEGGEIIKVRNRIQVKKGKNKIPNSNLSENRRKAKWSKIGECELTKGRKNDFERIEVEEIIRVSNRNNA